MGEYKGDHMTENIVFTDRVISRLQKTGRGSSRFVHACTQYLIKRGRLFIDLERDLTWVKLPNGEYQVAVWLIEVPASA